MNLLLDTHIWIWWVQGDSALLPKHRKLIESAETVSISAISCWELLMLIQNNKVQLHISPENWLALALEKSGIHVIAIDQNIALGAAQLPFHHKDPADRLILATSLAQSSYLLSYDRKFPLYTELAEFLVF